MTTKFSDKALQEADAAIKASQAYKTSRIDQRLGSVEDTISGLYNSPYTSIVQSDVASEGFALVQNQVNNFVKSSKILMSVLDEVAKAHPFIQVAVSLFKAGITLELTRRENDGKVLALNLTMCDMMQTLTLLKHIASPQATGSGGISIEERLRQRLVSIVESIKSCAKLCDSYQKRHIAIKFFTSLKWQGKFTEVAKTFANHKAGIQFDLQIHASVGVAAANLALSDMNDGVNELNENVTKLMEAVFERMRTPEERDLLTAVSAQPGGFEGVLEDDRRLERLLARRKTKEDNTGGKLDVGGSGQGEATLTVMELRKEIDKSVDQVLAENRLFAQKFEAMRSQIDEVKVTIVHESDRVINSILAGPHERIIDKDVYHVWKEMGWKGSVKAKHFVMALRDHFAERSHAALAAIRDIAEDADNHGPAMAGRAMQEIADIARRADALAPDDDEWTLQYITVLRVQPLIEALDDDVSSFVTIAEVNAFTSARPHRWSLPHWIAYWTYGFEMSVQWYFRRIRKVISEFLLATRAALPANYNTISNFIKSGQVQGVEDILSGLRDIEQWDDFPWDTDATFLKFKDYVMEVEERMERKLQSIKYCIDEANTLVIVAGPGRPEKNLLPLIFLLMRRALDVVRQAHSVTLHEDELPAILQSLAIIYRALTDRHRTLQAVYKLQNLNEKDQFEKYFLGLFSYALAVVTEKTEYWARNPDYDADAIVEVPPLKAGEDTSTFPLLHGPQIEALDRLTDPSVLNSDSGPSATGSVRSLVGHWTGYYSSPTRQGVLEFTISQDEDGVLYGYGADASGPVRIFALWDGCRMIMVLYGGEMREESKEGTDSASIWRADNLTSSVDEMEGRYGPAEGKWYTDAAHECIDGYADKEINHFGADAADGEGGRPPEQSHEEPRASKELEASFGSFHMKRRPVEYMLSRPSARTLAQSRPRALWTLATEATLRAVRAQAFTWKVLQERRRRRLRFIQLFGLQRGDGRFEQTEDEQEWIELIGSMSPDDLRLWSCLSEFQTRREFYHGVYCNGCANSSVTSTRFLCLDCSEDTMDSFDLCWDCFSSKKHILSPGKAHTPSHIILQLRVPRWRVYYTPLLHSRQDCRPVFQRGDRVFPGWTAMHRVQDVHNVPSLLLLLQLYSRERRGLL